jgi:hypothetical protein
MQLYLLGSLVDHLTHELGFHFVSVSVGACGTCSLTCKPSDVSMQGLYLQLLIQRGVEVEIYLLN